MNSRLAKNERNLIDRNFSSPGMSKMPFLEQSSSAKPTRDANAGGMEVSSLSDKPSFFKPWQTNSDLFGRGKEAGEMEMEWTEKDKDSWDQMGEGQEVLRKRRCLEVFWLLEVGKSTKNVRPNANQIELLSHSKGGNVKERPCMEECKTARAVR